MRRVENLSATFNPQNAEPNPRAAFHRNVIFPCGKLIRKKGPRPSLFNTALSIRRSHFEIPLVQIIRCGACKTMTPQFQVQPSKCFIITTFSQLRGALLIFYILCMLCRLGGISLCAPLASNISLAALYA